MDPVQSGVSQAGNQWQKTYFEIITNEGEYSKRVAFSAFGKWVEAVRTIPKGAHVEVRFTAESRDYTDKNGQKRYGTDLSCIGIAVITRQSMQPQYQPAATPQQFQQQYQQTPPPSAYPPAPPATGTAAPVQPAQQQTEAQPQLQYNDSGSPIQQQQPATGGELPPKNLGFQY